VFGRGFKKGMTSEEAEAASQQCKPKLIACAKKLSKAGICIDVLYPYNENQDSKKYWILLLRVSKKALCKMEFQLRVSRWIQSGCKYCLLAFYHCFCVLRFWFSFACLPLLSSVDHKLFRVYVPASGASGVSDQCEYDKLSYADRIQSGSQCITDADVIEGQDGVDAVLGLHCYDFQRM